MKWLACLLVAACAVDDPHELCSESLDKIGADPGYMKLEEQFSTARADHRVILFHGHKPGEVMPVEALAFVIHLAHDNGLPMLRYDEIATARKGGVALALDDDAIDDWFAQRDLFMRTHTPVTFFVTRWAYKTPDQIDKLVTLAGDGHELEPHTVNHQHAVAYEHAHGLDAWLADEVDPSIQVMRDAGLEPQFFAYPFGERDEELDRAMLERVQAVRATGHYCER